jgi:hypothetical protein
MRIRTHGWGWITAEFNYVSSFSRARSAAASIAIVLIAVVLGIGLASAPARSQGTPEQRHACEADARRLCSEFIPNVPAIIACMNHNSRILSAPCRVYFTPPRKG